MPASQERQLHPRQEHRHGAEMRRLGVVRVEGGQVGERASEHQQLDQVLIVSEVLRGGNLTLFGYFSGNFLTNFLK